MQHLIRLRSFLIYLVVVTIPLVARAAFDMNGIARSIGLPGTWNSAEGVFKVTVPRDDVKITVDGDFAVLEDELQPGLKSLRHDDINIVAIHSHMTHENPRILFLHYWGRGRASDLARSPKAAFETQAK